MQLEKSCVAEHNPTLTTLEQFNRFHVVWHSLKKQQSYYYQLGSLVFCLVFTEALLAKKIIPALAHLRIDRVAKVDFTIGLWETSILPGALPEIDWQLLNRNGYRGYHAHAIYLHYFDAIDAVSVINLQDNIAYYVVRDADALPWWVGGSPLQVILNVWLQKQGLQLTHAAAVGNDQYAVLLMGKGGSGKSTTTLTCLRDGLQYLGEDYCVLAADPKPMVYSIYQSAKWDRGTRHYFPEYERFIQNPHVADTEKALVYYQDFFSAQIKQALPIKAVVSLVVGDVDLPILQPSSRQDAVKNLMMSTLKQLPFSYSKTMRILHKLILSLDCYELILGKNLMANSACIKRILSGVNPL